MSTEQEKSTPAPDQVGIDRDTFLEILIVASERAAKMEEYPEHERTLDITLNVGGLIITGTLISRAAFIETVPVIKSTIGKIDEGLSAEVKTKRDESYDRHFIHLKNAKFITADGRTIPGTGDGIEWRGRLNRIDGWTIGRFTPAGEVGG